MPKIVACVFYNLNLSIFFFLVSSPSFSLNEKKSQVSFSFETKSPNRIIKLFNTHLV